MKLSESRTKLITNSVDFSLFTNYRRLKSIKRCNTLPTLQPTDVAQHSYYVALLSMAFADEYNTWAEEYNLDFHPQDFDNRYELINVEVLLRKALLHDVEEAFTSDIPWHVKHMSAEFNNTFTKGINEFLDKKYEYSKTMKMYQSLSKASKKGIEGELVNLADMVELAWYCYEEVKFGNQFFIYLLEKCLRIIDGYAISQILNKSSNLFRKIISMLDNKDSATYDID